MTKDLNPQVLADDELDGVDGGMLLPAVQQVREAARPSRKNSAGAPTDFAAKDNKQGFTLVELLEV